MRTEEQREAFNEGYNAYFYHAENPYDRDNNPDTYRAWAEGLQQAMEDD